VLELELNLKEVLMKYIELIFVVETIFLAKEHKIKAWSSKGKNIKSSYIGKFKKTFA
jgi:hypothetical protein